MADPDRQAGFVGQLLKFDLEQAVVWRDTLDERFAANKVAIFAVAAE